MTTAAFSSTAAHVVASATTTTATGAARQRVFGFGKWPIPSSEVFHVTPHSYSMVNYKPILPGHVLVVARRPVPRFLDLNPDEIADLWCTARDVGAVVQRVFHGTGLTFSLQDGVTAGQTVDQVHIHVIPRRCADLPNNDFIYQLIEDHERAQAHHFSRASPSPSSHSKKSTTTATTPSSLSTTKTSSPVPNNHHHNNNNNNNNNNNTTKTPTASTPEPPSTSSSTPGDDQQQQQPQPYLRMDADDQRKPRSADDMAEEAKMLRSHFTPVEPLD